MELFNWNAGPGEHIISSYLWIYFLITVCITVIILVTWLWWFRRSQRRHEQRIHDMETAIEDDRELKSEDGGTLKPSKGRKEQ